MRLEISYACSFQIELDFQDLILSTDDSSSKLIEGLLVLLEFSGILDSSVFRKLLDLERIVAVLKAA